ncbi:ribosome maturation factor RimP [Jatrophihabitans sp.]|uniref:ribosome maturation factor RimP n=1 Tax=Jatrophihabitans sp. TaxID=1932789 RepID=UPI0030C7641A|nr:hypothetical protein [Jatrophihabitans sp.]
MPPASASTPAAQLRAHLLDLLAPVVAATGHDLEDVSVTSAGRRSVIRVIVDAEGGVDLDAVAEISRAVSEVLDSDSPGGPNFADPYVLEVSSPGVDRPLTERRHWLRSLTRLVEVEVDGKAVIGRITSVDDAGVTLEVAGIKGRPSKTTVAAWSSLGRGRVQVEFNRKGTDLVEDLEDLEDDDDDDDEFDDIDDDESWED